MTQAQDEARRRNAQLSTGPKTEEGKSRMRLNALKHGIFMRSTDLSDLPCKGDGEFRECLEELMEHYQPETPVEKILVKRIALIDWRLSRTRIAERRTLHMQQGVEHALPPPGALERILKYERTMDRELYRAINHLEKLRAANLKNNQNKAAVHEGVEREKQS